MGKIYYIILISFVSLTINSCAETDISSGSANSSIKGQIWSLAYDILIGSVPISSNSLFKSEQISTEQGDNSNPKKNKIFLVKQNSSGVREWMMDLGISDEESGISMTFDSFDNVYLTVYASNGLEGKKASRDFTVFLVKHNSSGVREWIKKLGKSEVEYGARLIMDSSDKIYVTGFYSEFESDNEFGPRSTLLAKYDTSGNREWIKKLGSNLTGFSWDVTVDSMDNVYLSGFPEKSFAQKTSWQDDIHFMKFNTDGIKL